MLAAPGVQETGVTNAVAVMPAKNNSKRDSNSMTATIAEMQATAGMKATTGRPSQ
jgi:hypothetical protein